MDIVTGNTTGVVTGEMLAQQRNFSIRKIVYLEGTQLLDPLFASIQERRDFSKLVDQRMQTFEINDDDCRKFLGKGLHDAYNCLATWCNVPTNEIPGFRTHCGLQTLVSHPESEIGVVPSDKIMHALFNIKVMDSLLDSCRTSSDVLFSLGGAPSPQVAQNFGSIDLSSNPDVEKEFANRLLLQFPKDSSVLRELDSYVQVTKKISSQIDSSQSQPGAEPQDEDRVMSDLMQVQDMHRQESKKHATMARLFELSIVLRAWLIVGQ
jgi:hypothetical protein